MLAPDQFTHYPDNGNNPSVIDFAIVKNIKNIKLNMQQELSADHYPLTLNLNAKVKHNKTQKFFNYKTANWKKFRKHIETNHTVDFNLDNSDKIELAVSNLTNSIQKAMYSSIKLHKPKSFKQNLDTVVKFH